MTALPFPSKAALQAGVPPRFLYWQGHSRRRYLFTRTSIDALSGFDDGVVIAVHDGEIVWTGEISDIATLPADPELGRDGLHVHLLAQGAAERRAVVADFWPHSQHCLAA